MALSIFDIFKIGIGPSSSHTVGPMWAGHRFLNDLREKDILDSISSVRVGLYGSLALTGKGHATDKATILGLAGYRPDDADPDKADQAFEDIVNNGVLKLAGEREIPFNYDTEMVFHYGEELEHPNGMRIYAADQNGIVVYYKTYLSIGGGFVVCADEYNNKDKQNSTEAPTEGAPKVPYPFNTAAELLCLCEQNEMSIADLVIANERALTGGDADAVYANIDAIWDVMRNCIDRGLRMEGILPISNMKRRASTMHQQLMANPEAMLKDHFSIMDWVTLFAMAVNEENACGGRVVTAPTNGAAGIIPAVLAYYTRFIDGADQKGTRDFIATAAAIGMLYKMNATISGAEAGCQAEVGSACSMAAGALAAVMGGNVHQVENAAEIGMEHNLGMTCDPIGGLVQVPCIERNGMAAIKAITATRMALRGDGNHEVSLDSCIETMYRTGLDLQSKYRETSTGGLAVFAKPQCVA
ncbi:L-serine ammonia-lyase [Sansalvadorimonas sp. 2012CJ34-2]|uniref:L-serine dehydratase n=1 Tax=Parendozoicomonas callyspongiae TaxID=2942213 RepID=A0ABT0PKA4_9GAMM|nr:L-serine ammonia-lyase [Sansalvadorimonas sp. 2012CJ34-2]MCL6271406.1 L-serine ammonia-lyase [Sansalvadorimonas sp. 2012CJ34-2]